MTGPARAGRKGEDSSPKWGFILTATIEGFWVSLWSSMWWVSACLGAMHVVQGDKSVFGMQNGEVSSRMLPDHVERHPGCPKLPKICKFSGFMAN